ncbi:molybdenum cofactor guanylyltransferase [Marinactinospora thermotolerans]|uniref:Molybdopterin-guanine dinucleotide biosynthesis protein A n=1 Tax=Marinactinospora thermotolerans DSM 45154 TaxID=1122192 RepID=A0A1T4KDN4_9ACTN|nr:molybdenum cofactor guanylyltransferase [Marinactinospora thermotolerans]SJZ40568.1 Molybdopterin-guanine dinucleotide biosynthesis protein A [Marinactinospora thermotolerans DSM 45154]
MARTRSFDAVILAGGAARRLGGVDKPGLDVGGTTLVERVAAAARGARRLVIVGPERSRPAARYVREDPPGGGPVPALRAGIAQVDAPWCAVLAADMPFFTAADLERLLAAAEGANGAVAVDAEGHPQWLAGIWSTHALRRALADYAGRSLRGLLAPLEPVRVSPADLADSGIAVFDCDTPEALARARATVRPPRPDEATG